MLVSFIIVAYNEENTLKEVFNNIKKQDYPHSLIEIILVDGMSMDNTRKIMTDFKNEKNDFYRITIKENYKKTLPCGWNVALKESTGDLIIRIDAHATIPCDFISKNVDCIKSGEKICGGYRPNIIDDETDWKKTLLLAETSMFGSSIAPYRRNKGKRYVKSVFHGAYSREVFDDVGYYNEQLARTEDNEMHYRMRVAGYKICFNPNIISYQHTRNSLQKMLRQKYLNGYWIGITSGVCLNCFSIYHFIPFLFVTSIILTTILSILGLNKLSILMWSIYWIVNILMSILAVKGEKFNFSNFLLPILFFLLHVSYGIGTFIGLTKLPTWLIKNKNNLRSFT